MKATIMYSAGDVRVEDLPEPTIQQPTDAIVRMVRTCVCGSDLHPYRQMHVTDTPCPMGHELLGVVEELGGDVKSVAVGDLVIASFAFQDNTCGFCREGVQTSCLHGGCFGSPGIGGQQAEFSRIPLADGTLVKVPGLDGGSAEKHADLLPHLLTLSDVYLTGYHAAHVGRVQEGSRVGVVGDGAVGLSAVLAARRLGAEQIVLLSHHAERAELGVEWGATNVVTERGDQAVDHVLDMTNGQGLPILLEAVGLMPAYEQCCKMARPGGVISRVGVPQYENALVGGRVFADNISVTGGLAPVRAYMEPAVQDVLDGTVTPGRVFDEVVSLVDVPRGYADMDGRRALKVLVTP